MRSLLALLGTAALILSGVAQAQQQDQAQLDALLAPVALYPDDVVRTVLDAATAPAQITEAAQWSRNNQGMTAEDSVRAVDGYPWRPSVKALVAYPELLQRMAESPQWTYDLGSAWLAQQAQVMATIQALRQRAYSNGTLQSDPYQTVQPTDQGIAVVPTMPYIYYVPYYNPMVVYGGWWWPAYRPVYWRPWYARPVFVTRVAVVSRGFAGPRAFVTHNGPPSPAVRMQQQQSRQFVGRQQAQRQPSPAVQFQNRMTPSSFQNQRFHQAPQAGHAPVMQSHAAPRPPMAYQHPSGGGHPIASGRSSGGGFQGSGGHRGRS